MRGRVPEWLSQVVGGLNDRKDWLVRELQSLPITVRLGGWVVFQAILFKIQPKLWSGLLALTTTVGRLGTMKTEVQLLFLVVALLPVQTAVLVFTFKEQEIVVEIVNKTERDADGAVADGGLRAEYDESEQQPETTGFGAALGVLSGAAFGSLFGPAGTLGVAVLGAILGDEYERRKRANTRTVVYNLEG